MLCPLPQSIVAFEPIWHLLADRYQLLALDLPGFGGSEGGEEFMTFEAQGKFLNSFVAEMGLSSFHIIGPDVGMSGACPGAGCGCSRSAGTTRTRTGPTSLRRWSPHGLTGLISAREAVLPRRAARVASCQSPG
jgi:hypothetical protein